MITVLPFNKNLFNDFNLERNKITKYTYINNIDLVSKLLSVKLPIANTKLALRNIFDFLSYIDNLSDRKNNTLISISSKVLVSYFTTKKYKEYTKLLEELNVLTKVPYENGSLYTTGVLSSQFRIHNSYLNEEDLAIIILEDGRSKTEFINEVLDLDPRYINTINKLEIDVKNAIEAEIAYFNKENISISVLRNRISRIFYTKRKRFIKKGKKVDRIYHSFTNVSRVSRKHLNIKMYDIDIKNCQPLLLVAYLKKNNLLSDIEYQHDCESGNFYERFVGINNLDRNKTKVQIYKNIFFAFNERSKFNKRFKELYPNTWCSLQEINKSDTSLASLLQNIESELFNNLIPIKSKFFFTLFDAIYFDDVDDISDLIYNVNKFFNELNIKVQIEIGL